MKKYLLALMALSTVAFGANPGENVPTESGNRGTVGVPLEVRVTVLPKGPQLVLVDENNTLIDKLTFDHGNMVAGLSKESKIEKEVRLVRADGKAFATNGTDTYKAKFEASDLNGTAIDGSTPGNLALNGHGGASGEAIASTLNFRTGDIAVGATDKMVMTKVQSIVGAIGEDQEPGLYVGSGTFNATLTMN
ncbi:MAG: hypothetical protein ACRC1R_04965 [Cetobacterium sp.]|uniref:hypothetical protein n=1 Tax=Cetobacterium sp. TaxID=2071632 RepID=UPI003F30104F